MQVARNSGPSNMYILVFFDHNHRLMFQSSCFVGFHTKAQRISLFYHFSFLTQRSPWYSWSVFCGWLIFLVFIFCLHLFQFCLNSPTVCFSVCLFFFLSSLDVTLFLSLPLCVHLAGRVHIVADIRDEIRRSILIEAKLHSHSEAP